LGQRYSTERGVLLQEEIDFGNDINQETDAWTQPANGYKGTSQDLSSDHRAIKV